MGVVTEIGSDLYRISIYVAQFDLVKEAAEEAIRQIQSKKETR